ncbi:MAG: DUF465 domain-containing protein [Candidatus Tectomicrobia bacterium]
MLGGTDLALIERVKQENAEFRRLLDEHQDYEVQLVSYDEMRYRTSEQELARKRLQKLKLLGKDRLLAILSQYGAS